MSKTEVEKLLEGLEGESKVQTEETPKEVPEKEVDPEKVPDSMKNRQHRRLEKRLHEERQSSMEMANRLSEMDKKLQAIQSASKASPLDERLRAIFGDEGNGPALVKHFSEILGDFKGQARAEALAELREEAKKQKEAEIAQVQEYESKIENGIESIEDKYDIDLSGEDRDKFLNFITKVSPKDADGNPTYLPDFLGTWEIYQSQQKPAVNNARQKEIASRSMKSPGQANVQKEQMTEAEAWLKKNGIIN